MNFTNKLREETESARCHNIDAEDAMGMFSATKNNAPNTTLNYLSSKIRAQKNGVVEYLEQENRNKVVQMSKTIGRKQRQTSRRKFVQIREELSQRIAPKRKKKVTAERNKGATEHKTVHKNQACEVGIKIFTLTEAKTGYALNLLPYVGKREDTAVGKT
ncbi:hypothetical protein LSAT2_020555, partial [Lamellibrachia satsuma]